MNSDKPVLIAYDGSDGAARAIAAAGALFPGRAASVLTVWHSTRGAAPATLVAIPAGVAAEAYERLDAEVEQQAAATAEQGVSLAGAAGLNATPVTRLSGAQAWATIVDAADEIDAAAIVVGSRGRSGIRSALLGSVANGVVHHASRPVLVTPAGAGS